MRWLLYRFLPYYLVLGLLLSLGLLLFTELGLRIIWQQLEPRLPEQLQVESVYGRLTGKLGVRNLRYQQGDNRIEIKQAWLDWRPLDLLSGRIHVREIVVADATIDWPGGSAGDDSDRPSQEPQALPRLPDMELGELQLRQISIAAGGGQPVMLERLRLHAEMKDQRLSVTSRKLVLRDQGEWALRLHGQIQADALQVTELNVRGLDDPVLNLAGEAECDWPLSQCHARLSWNQLRWPLTAGRWFSPAGQLRARFAEGQLQAQLDAELHGEQLPPSDLQATLSSQEGPAYRLEAAWQSQSGQLDAHADYVDGRIQGGWRIGDLDLAYWHADWPSKLSSSGLFQRGADGALELEQIRLQGQVRERPVTLQAAVGIAGQQWDLKALDGHIGKTRLRGRVARRAGWDGQLSLDSPDLAALYPGLGGRLSLNLGLAGQRKWPDLRWQISGEKISWQEIEVAALKTQGRSTGKSVQGHIEVSRALLPGVTVDRLRLDTSGDAGAGESRLELATSLLTLEVSGRHRWQNEQLDLSLEQGSLALEAERWELVTGGTLQAGARHLELGEQCWHSQDSRSCLRLQWRVQLLQGDWQLTDYALARLNHFLPEGVRLAGTGNVSLSIPPSSLQDLQLELMVRTRDVQLARRFAEDDEELLLAFAPGQLQASRQGGQTRLQWQFPLQSASGLSGELELDAEQQVDGRLRLAINELTWLGALVPEILQAEGRIDGDLAFSGPARHPRLSGELLLRDGRIQLDGPEIELQELRAGIHGSGDTDMDFELHAKSGDGQLDMDGRFSWLEQPVLNARIQGRNFLAVDTPEARVLASPDLELALAGRDVQLRGRLLIPAARIQPRELNASGRQARAPSPDQVIVGEEAVPASSAYRIRSRVELALGDDVSFSGFGLNAALAGQLTTRMIPGKPPTGVGELRLVNGRYKAYGQDLQIERGRLIYSGGPLSEPGLDFRAYRQATADIRAGVVVRGTVKNPEISLYSEPSMRETDQLSYLVLGRAAESQNDSDQAALNNAALALGLKGSDFLANRFKGKLGLDEVRIGTQPGETSNQASLVLGKYLNPDLYISYGVGLFEPVYTFRMRYRLHRRWTVETESGLESGGDIFYTIER